jgi:RNA-binding protein
MPLKPSRRSELRAQAHKLSPVVIIGDKGLTDEVIAEIDRSLKAHELIKVRAGTDDRDARKAWLPTICERLSAEAVQSIGKVFVIFRENPKEKVDVRPPASDSRLRGNDKKARGNDKKARGNEKKPRENDKKANGTSRLRSRTPSARPESEPRRRRPRSSR